MTRFLERTGHESAVLRETVTKAKSKRQAEQERHAAAAAAADPEELRPASSVEADEYAVVRVQAPAPNERTRYRTTLDRGRPPPWGPAEPMLDFPAPRAPAPWPTTHNTRLHARHDAALRAMGLKD